MALLNLLWEYAVPTLILLTVLVYVHEFGHYWVARRCGVRVEVFSIGFGPEIYGWTAKSGTRWKFSAIPLGGYVKMHGESGEPDEAGDRAATVADEESFSAKPLSQRAAIVVAGPAANFIFAIIVYAGLYTIVGESVTPPVVTSVAAGSVAEDVGIRVGDVVRSVDGSKVDRFEDVGKVVRPFPGMTMEIVVERDGKQVSFTPTIESYETKDFTGADIRIGRLGIEELRIPPAIEVVQPGTAAADAGFLPGDTILRIDDKPVAYFDEVFQIVSAAAGKTLAIEVMRDGRPVVLQAVPSEIVARDASGAPRVDADGKPVHIGRLGIQARPVSERRTYDPATAVWRGTQETYFVTIQTLKTLGQMIVGNRSAKELGGPIRIAQISGDTARAGLASIIFVAALLSINLGLINLFPVPMLDGGHLMFYAIEAIRGRPLGERAREYGFRIGLALVLSLMLFVTWNDLARLPIIDFFVGLVT